MEGSTADALIPEIVRRGFQDLLEAEVSAAIGAQLHERRPVERSTHRNGYRETPPALKELTAPIRRSSNWWNKSCCRDRRQARRLC
jgi:transposase-like protein